MRILTSTHKPGGPFSAVRPYPRPEIPQEDPSDEVDVGGSEKSARSNPGSSARVPTDELRRSGGESAAAALAAFPQVIHLLTATQLKVGRDLAEEVGLPLVSLEKHTAQSLAYTLQDERFSQGFIIEGIPQNLDEARRLDELLSNTGANERRVLSLELEFREQQDVLDHYVDSGLLWMIPDCDDPANPEKVKQCALECLVGLPVKE